MSEAYNVPKAPKKSLYIYPPRADESAGYKLLFTPVWNHPLAVLHHVFNKLPGQASIVSRDGNPLERFDRQRAICLGTPQRFYEPGMDLVLDPEGVNKCMSIKLPGDIPLHMIDHERVKKGGDHDGRWEFIVPLVEWNMDTSPATGEYKILSSWATQGIWSVILTLWKEQRDLGREPTTYVTALRPAISSSGRRSGWSIDSMAIPGPLPPQGGADEQHQRDWKKFERAMKPFRTAEEIVADLGITSYNPAYAQGAYAQGPPAPVPTPPSDPTPVQAPPAPVQQSVPTQQDPFGTPVHTSTPAPVAPFPEPVQPVPVPGNASRLNVDPQTTPAPAAAPPFAGVSGDPWAEDGDSPLEDHL